MLIYIYLRVPALYPDNSTMAFKGSVRSVGNEYTPRAIRRGSFMYFFCILFFVIVVFFPLLVLQGLLYVSHIKCCAVVYLAHSPTYTYVYILCTGTFIYYVVYKRA